MGHRRLSSFCILSVLLGILVFGGVQATAEEPETNMEQITLHLYASRYEFNPNHIVLPVNANVTIFLHAEDNIHGFWLEGYNIKALMCNDHVFTVSFVTEKTGTFFFRCSEPACGVYHPYMVGRIRVDGDLPGSFLLPVIVTGIIVAISLFFKLRKDVGD